MGGPTWAGAGRGGCALGSQHFFAPYYSQDATTLAAREVLEHIPPDASVQAPDALLPHLAERRTVHREPPPERHVDYWVLDVSHRERYAGQGTLLRTAEEPRVRALMAREDRGVRVYQPPFVLLQRGLSPRAALGAFLDTESTESTVSIESTDDREAGDSAARTLTRCLTVTHVTHLPRATERGAVRLHFRAHGPCPADLALRVGTHAHPRRVELLFGGAVSPVVLQAGDQIFTDVPRVVVGSRDVTHIHVGALRSSGARPEPGDPTSVALPLPSQLADPASPTSD